MATLKARNPRKFTTGKAFTAQFQQPAMVEAAEELLTIEHLSEEGFLGAQAVLMLNGLI